MEPEQPTEPGALPLPPQRPQRLLQCGVVAVVVDALEARLAGSFDVVRQGVEVDAGGGGGPAALGQAVAGLERRQEPPVQPRDNAAEIEEDGADLPVAWHP